MLRSQYSRADLPSIRAAILKKRPVRFVYRGEMIFAEPHVLGRALRTRALNLKCFDLNTETWRFFSFCELKDFEICQGGFGKRDGVKDRNRKIIEVDTEARY